MASGAIKFNTTASGSLTLKVDDALATDEVFEFNGVSSSGKSLSGAELTAVGIIGTNPQATLWPDGSITGSSDNGKFIKGVNGYMTVFVDKTNATTDTSHNITLPMVFSQAPYCSISQDSVSPNFRIQVTCSTTTATIMAESTTTKSFKITAIGKY